MDILGITVRKSSRDGTYEFCCFHPDELPVVLYDFILEEYHVLFCSADYLGFNEFRPIGTEIDNEEMMD